MEKQAFEVSYLPAVIGGNGGACGGRTGRSSTTGEAKLMILPRGACLQPAGMPRAVLGIELEERHPSPGGRARRLRRAEVAGNLVAATLR